MTAVHVVVPDGIDDPTRPSGGNTYDRRICAGLASSGWLVHEYGVAGVWPWPDEAARAALAGVIGGIPDGAVVLIDGLIASTVPEILVPAADRLRLVILMHMPLGVGSPTDPVRTAERAVLSAAVTVIATSAWTQEWLVEQYAVRPDAVHVAEPGVDAANLASVTPAGGELLCVAAVTPGKGQDVLFTALATITDLPWRCVCVGSLDRDPDFVAGRVRQIAEDGMGDRVRLVRTKTGIDLDAAYAGADLLVLASHAETYGMVVTEALARGLPVIATVVGGLPAALGRAADGSRPGLLVPPDDPAALAAALRRWLRDGALRERLRRAAGERRRTLPGWSTTTDQVSQVLAGVAARPGLSA